MTVPEPASPSPTRITPGLAPLPQKEVGYAYLFMLFTLIGVAGVQHFYLGKIGRGILWVLTFGIFGIGTIIDLFTLPSQTRMVNAQRAAGIK